MLSVARHTLVVLGALLVVSALAGGCAVTCAECGHDCCTRSVRLRPALQRLGRIVREVLAVSQTIVTSEATSVGRWLPHPFAMAAFTPAPSPLRI
jgi:hypothetical protein